MVVLHADDDLWEEVGEEVPWQDSEPVVKTKGKAVPPGEYFTVVKGYHTNYRLLLTTSASCQLASLHHLGVKAWQTQDQQLWILLA